MAWTVTGTYLESQKREDGTYHKFSLACSSDASASGDFKLSVLLRTTHGHEFAEQIIDIIRGSELAWVDYAPGSATPTSNPTVTLDNENGSLIFSYAFTAATAEVQAGAITKGGYPPIEDLIFASTTLANGKTATIYIWLKK